MYIPNLVKRNLARKYGAPQEGYGSIVQIGSNTSVAFQQSAAKKSVSLPRYKIGSYSNVFIKGTPDIATIFLGDFSTICVSSYNQYIRDFISVSGKDFCEVTVQSEQRGPGEEYDEPSFMTIDPLRNEDQKRFQPMISDLVVDGDSFKLFVRFDNTWLHFQLASQAGEVAVSLRGKHLFTMREGQVMRATWYRSWNVNDVETAIYKALRKEYFQSCKNKQEINQRCKSVVA